MTYFLDIFVSQVLKQRRYVLVIAILIFGYGLWQTITAPVDILPDLNRPTVTIFASREGYATEEMELLVATPVEAVMNGASGVERVRSISSAGLSLVFVEFDWGQDIYIARQIINEKIASVAIPEGVEVELGPISSIMGEIQLLGIGSTDNQTHPRDLRTLVDFTIRPKLLTIKGVAAVTVIGGEILEYQILLDPVRLANYQLGVGEIEAALAGIVENKSGGFLATSTLEYPIRIIGQTTDSDVLAQTVIGFENELPIVLADVATVEKSSQLNPRGDASINGSPGVILSITKQPGINTLALTETIDTAIDQLDMLLPDDVVFYTDLFTQEKFIKTGINNVTSATRDAAVLVILVLILFLGNLRALTITLIALPCSFVVAIIFLELFGIGINVMTLGGLAVAIGELTDDAVVDLENTLRWLRENSKKPKHLQKPVIDLVLESSKEVRGSVVYSTVIVVLVFLPLFALGGIEGRLLAPLGIAYIVALLASTLVAMTITVILSYWLLPSSRMVEKGLETSFVRWIKIKARPWISYSIAHPRLGVTIALVSIVFTMGLMWQSGKEFLPPFNEGTLTINVVLEPGASILQSNTVGTNIEKRILSIPAVKTVARRTGRAEDDEHANGVNISELEVDIDLTLRRKDDIIEDVKQAIAQVDIGEASVSIGQPISHRIEHILSGVRAPLVIKVFGPDMDQLKIYADQVKNILVDVPGTLNPVVQQEVKVPQITITPDRWLAAQYGYTFDKLTEAIEMILAGSEVGTILDGNQSYNVILKLDASFSKDIRAIRNIPLITPHGQTISLSQIAKVTEAEGRNTISHDNGQRRLVISSGILDGDSVTIIETLKDRVASELEFAPGYFLSYEGTYKSQQESSRKLLAFSILSFLGIIAVLYVKFGNISFVLQVLANIPVTYLGAMIAIFFTGNIVSLASLVGLISILGLATRNGILLIEHWIYMVQEEGEIFSDDMILRGSLNRLVPMLMTSLTSMLALVPLLLSPDQPGKELLYPLAVATFGGLLTSLLVEVLVRPGMFKRYGRKPMERLLAKKH